MFALIFATAFIVLGVAGTVGKWMFDDWRVRQNMRNHMDDDLIEAARFNNRAEKPRSFAPEDNCSDTIQALLSVAESCDRRSGEYLIRTGTTAPSGADCLVAKIAAFAALRDSNKPL